MGMIIKVVGMCLIFSSCTLAGLSCSGALSDRSRALELLIRMLMSLSGELSYNHSSTRLAVSRIYHLADGSAKLFLEEMARGMEEGMTPPESWRGAAMSLADIDRGDRQELAALSESLGASNIDGQRAAIECCIHALKQRQEQAAYNRDQRARIYRTLGLLAGAAVVVVVL